MNQILLSHQQRQNDKLQIIKGVDISLHEFSQAVYFERQRQRQKKQNIIISHLKKGSKTFNSNQLKKTFLSHTIIIMNSYLQENNQIIHPYKKDHLHSKTTESSEKFENYTQNLNLKHCQISESSIQKSQSNQKLQPELAIDQKVDSEENNNFYQIYINLFVNFFNQQADLVNLNTIKSIIRPNNRFVIIDLLKALLQFCRNQLKTLIKNTTFFSTKNQKFLMPRNNTDTNLPITNQIPKQNSEAQVIVDFQSSQKNQRRVYTQPEVNYPQNTFKEAKQFLRKISPVKQFRTKNSTPNFLKHNSAEHMKAKMEEVQELNNRYLQAHFIDTNIKQTMYQKNYEFVNQVNLEKLQSRINNIYIELNRLNVGNNQIITKYYEQSMGRTSKFNYDPRGLYSESQILAKKEHLLKGILEFQERPFPNKRSNSVQLTEYAQEFCRYKNKQQELNVLNRSKNKLAKAVSGWLPLKIQQSQSIVEPLKLEIQEFNPNTGQQFSYHWKKYKKEFCIADFLKQRVKTEYQKIKQKHGKLDKNVQKELFKKKKFRKSLFLDNRKKINDFIQSNNVIFTKKQSIFPALKGIHQNHMKNSNTMAIQQPHYALETHLSKSKEIRIDFRQQQRLKFSQNLTCKASSSNYPQSREKEKRFESVKRKGFEGREKSERKYSESDKLLEKIPEKQAQKNDILSKLSVKYDLPIAISSNRNYKQSQKYEKKNLISMSKIIDLRMGTNSSQGVSKMLQIQTSPDKKLTILNLF